MNDYLVVYETTPDLELILSTSTVEMALRTAWLLAKRGGMASVYTADELVGRIYVAIPTSREKYHGPPNLCFEAPSGHRVEVRDRDHALRLYTHGRVEV